MHTKVEELLKLAVANKVSDIHLSAGVLPRFRLSGELIDVVNFEILEEEVMTEMVWSMISSEQGQKLEKEREIDFSLAAAGVRFRVNMFYKMGKVSCSLRLVPSVIPGFEELGLPSIFGSLVDYKQGFVLVTGPTGQGKSTTVASVLNKINQSKSCHIVTIEDPIEYVLVPEKSIISQREIGYDSNSFTKALKSCLRQDPNVVFVGEMRDLETIASALTIAETGHLVFSTLHTNSAAQTIDRIIDVFPEGSKEQIRVQLASVITAVVSQRLIPAINGGRVAAFEILVATGAVKNCIREGKTFMIDNIIQTSADLGMVGLETSLATLVKSGVISEEVALNYCLRPLEFQNKLRSLRTK